MPEPELLFVLGAGAWYVWDRHVAGDDAEPDEWTPEGSAAAYSRGEISRDEHARRSAAAIEAEPGFRDSLEQVQGVGPELSGPIRAEFSGEQAIRNADRDELEAIHGVGESKAAALKERFS